MSMDVEQSIKGFVKVKRNNEMLPGFRIYQNLVYSYFIFKKLIKTYNSDFLLVTGNLTELPKSMAERTIVYVNIPTNLEILPLLPQDYTSKIWKRLYIQPYLFISNNYIDFSYIKKGTIIANSNYTRNAIKKVWNIDSTVIYPPCPQYSFPLEDKIKKIEQDTEMMTVCTLSRFVPEKEYDTILQIAKQRPQLKFELIGGVAEDKISYLTILKNKAPRNVTIHVNATENQKMKSKQNFQEKKDIVFTVYCFFIIALKLSEQNTSLHFLSKVWH